MAKSNGRHQAPHRTSYPPGYFTELLFAHNWPPNWQPAIQSLNDWRSGFERQQQMMLTRERAAADGALWAQGTLDMPNTRHVPKPGWSQRSGGG